MKLNSTVFVEIKLLSQVDDVLEEFEKAVRLIPEVLECHLMAGSADYLLKVVVADAEGFERTTGRMARSHHWNMNNSR